MKVCEHCGAEIDGKDGENHCTGCDGSNAGNKTRKAAQRRRERQSVLRDLGLVKVRGALGGTYWE